MSSYFADKPVQLSFGEKLTLFRAALAACTTFDRWQSITRSYKHEARNLFHHFLLRRLTVRHMQFVLPGTHQVVQDYCRKHQLPYASDQVKFGNVIHWMGERSSTKKVLLYFPGGGFGLPASSGHIDYIGLCQQKLQKKGKDVVVAVVQYGLAPNVRYPESIKRGVECLRFVLSQYQPQDILLAGDDAGGNMCLSVLSHILHPHPKIEKLNLPTPLAGLLLISPWVTFQLVGDSYYPPVADRDSVLPEHLLYMSKTYVSDDEISNYVEPLNADIYWWKGLPVVDVLVLCGQEEMMMPDISSFARKLEDGTKGKVEVKLVVCEKEIHGECILDVSYGLEPGRMALESWRWLEEKM